MLLAVDIGNTNITLGVFKGEDLVATWRIATEAGRMPDEYGLAINQLLPLKGVATKDISDVVVCNVVPPLTPTFIEVFESYLNVTPLVVGAGTKTGIRILYDSPRDVGTDRIVDAAAALRLYGGPAIIVDIGTFTVFDAVTKDGDYIGGAIALGLAEAADALFHRAAQLRRVELKLPPSAIGKNTINSIQSGIVLGHADLITGMVSRFDRELGGDSKVIATGGLASIIESEIDVFDAVDPNLTLSGLRIVYEMNR